MPLNPGDLRGVVARRCVRRLIYGVLDVYIYYLKCFLTSQGLALRLG